MGVVEGKHPSHVSVASKLTDNEKDGLYQLYVISDMVHTARHEPYDVE